jgi:uncharacterized membrane protein
MNKSEKIKSNRINIKKEKLIVSYLWIIFSIFGIIFYTFIIVDGFGFLGSIILLIIGVSLTILFLKGKLCFIRKWEDKNIYLIFSILYYILGVLNFLFFIVNPYRHAQYLIYSLPWLVLATYYTLLHVKFFKMKTKKRNNLN